MSAGSAHPGRRLGVVALLGWSALLVVAALAVHRVGGPLAPPPLTEPSLFDEWLAARQPAEAAAAVARLVALGTAWYLLATTVAGLVARVAGVAALVRATDAMTLPFVRRLVNGALGLSFATAALAGAAGAAVADEGGGAAGPADTVVMRRLPDAATATSAVPAATAVGGGEAPPVMRRLDDTGPATTTSTAAAAAATPEPTPARAPAPGPATREIKPGDHFWAVAERVLAEAWRRPPADAEVDSYWRALVAANTDVLRDRSNPDLLFPGQVITLPPPPPAPH